MFELLTAVALWCDYSAPCRDKVIACLDLKFTTLSDNLMHITDKKKYECMKKGLDK